MQQKQKSQKDENNSDQSQLYDVQQIIDRQQQGKNKKYLIKWRGYSEQHNTWEPVSSLGNVVQEISLFEEYYGKGEKRVIQIEPSSESQDNDSKNEKEQSDNQTKKAQNPTKQIKKLIKKNPKSKQEEKQIKNELQFIKKARLSAGQRSPIKKKLQAKKIEEKLESENENEKTSKQKESAIQNNNILLSAQHVPLSNHMIVKGSFEAGDTPRSILKLFQNEEGSLLSMVAWEQRKDGTRLEHSSEETWKFRKNYPDLLIDFYESHITFKKDE